MVKINLKKDIVYDSDLALTVAGENQTVEIDGQGHTISRGSNCSTQIFIVGDPNSQLTFKNEVLVDFH